MATDGLRQRASQLPRQDSLDIGAGATPKAPTTNDSSEPHPAGRIKHGPLTQLLRAVGSVGWLVSSALFINITQYLGTPLYWLNKEYYYWWMARTKEFFTIILITVTQFFSPTLMRVSWDSSVRGEIYKAKDGSGRLETTFPHRVVLMANHQIYTDWVYLWWIAYTSRMHGSVYIILKESLKYVPFIGQGMMFYGFIFMARKWDKDKPRLAHRLQKLKQRYGGSSPGFKGRLVPMWLFIFPEGTNLSANTRKKSVAWSQKSGVPDMKHQLIPRSTGMYFCLSELADTVEWVYDCTVAYEGTPPGGYAQDYFTLRSTFLQGRPPRSVNFHWRKFAVKDIPLESPEAFNHWVEARWREKDQLLDTYLTTGRFPADQKGEYIETEVKLRNRIELVQPYFVVLVLALLGVLLTGYFKKPTIS